LLAIVGKREIWRSLGTDSPTVAVSRSHQIAAELERQFEAARAQAGLPVDQTILVPVEGQTAQAAPALSHRSAAGLAEEDAARGPTLREVYDAYMSDPTRDWSPRTQLAYQTTRTRALAILGEDTPMRSITRAHCRELIEVMRGLPRHASKLYPGLSAREIAAKAKEEGRTDLISAANLNAYLNKLCGVFNWAMKEQLIDRNPAVGLRVPDPTLRREKRLPYSTAQLRAIFSAPLYRGCQDDGHGYARRGSNRPRNARFCIPLVGLFCGLRLNEICQLDVADIQAIDGIVCFAVTASAMTGQSDKLLKTASSERLVPVHPELLALGFTEFVTRRRREGEVKLFAEVDMGATGYRSSTFSAWFTRFARKAGADAPKTCFHSFRHVFRDALREARVDRDIALMLGGWSRSGGSGGSSSVSDAYGSGYRVGTLFEAISRVTYPDLDLSHLNQAIDLA
jgi:integrase